jgi:hypothetical protein
MRIGTHSAPEDETLRYEYDQKTNSRAYLKEYTDLVQLA